MHDSQRNPQHLLEQILTLLEKQHLVEHMIHGQGQRKHELVESLISRQHQSKLQQKLEHMHAADVAYVLEALPPEFRILVWKDVGIEQGALVLLEIAEAVRPSLIAGLGEDRLTAMLRCLDGDDLGWIADDLPAELLDARRRELSQTDQQWLRRSLRYAEDQVGFLMTDELIRARQTSTVAEAIEQIRCRDQWPHHMDKLLVINHLGVLTGIVSLAGLLMAKPEQRLAQIMDREVYTFRPDESGESAGRSFERYNLVSAPVVDERGKLIGRLTVDVVMDHLRERVQEDALNSVGLKEDEDLFSPVWKSARNRWLWVGLNLVTAFIASRVIGAFEEAIMQLVALAALMPIVASVGGNTGNQTTALVIRGLALEQIAPGNRRHLLRKELGVALLNGAVWGGVVGLFTLLFYGDWALMAVITVAMSVNLLIAALTGVGVPLLLERMNRDPAMGSSVLLTATTDTMGFLIFLGLAALFLV